MNLKEKVKEAFEQTLEEGTSEGVKKAWLKRKRKGIRTKADMIARWNRRNPGQRVHAAFARED